MQKRKNVKSAGAARRAAAGADVSRADGRDDGRDLHHAAAGDLFDFVLDLKLIKWDKCGENPMEGGSELQQTAAD